MHARVFAHKGRGLSGNHQHGNKGPPEINPELKNQSVAYNSSLQFICSLSGFPTPEILWTKDGVNLGNNNTLTINRVSYGDAGQYTCSAKNSEGSKNSTFWIEVAGVSLQITEPPISQFVTEEYPVNLSCVASGVPTPTLVWTFNNGDLPSGINQTGYEGGSILVSPSVTREMNGTYKCTAKNKANTISSSATLRVYGKASARVVSEKYITLIKGYALALTCKVNEETISVMWEKDGERITERAVIETRLDEKKSKLALTEVVEEDSGEYSCEARNKLGTVARSVVIVNVKGNSEAPSSSSSSSSSSLEWYYIGGPLAAVVFLLALISYIKKRRETAPPHVPSRPNEGEDEVELDKLNAVVAIDDGATALPLGIKAGEEGCLAHPSESDKRRGEAGVQEYDGNQLTAADTDENGNDEGEESSEAAPLVQD
nr:hemicentin-1-like [Pocillopora verrucosa]